MQLFATRTEGLGDSTYLLVHEGTAVLVDPQRDVDRFLEPLDAAGAELRWVLETHLHNDYVSGGREAARRTGAELVLPAAAAAAFRYTPAFHQEDLAGGGPLTIRPIHTPGHTPEHTSYLVFIDGEPVALFSGGSLLVGAAGRPDLLGPERADTLARLQYRSVRRLAELPDDVGLYPTHGEGSFCTASGAGRHTSTIGEERRTNPVLAYPDEDAFVAGQLSVLQPYPSYYRYMGPINLMGPDPLPDSSIPTLTVEELKHIDAVLVDMRPKTSFAAGHIPGSVGVELRNDFGTWVGWLVDFHSPLVLIAEAGEDLREAEVQLRRIGMDNIVGFFLDLEGWRAAGGDWTSFETASVRDLAKALDEDPPPQVLDVRSPGEVEMGTLAGAVTCYVPDLAGDVPADLDPARPVWVICGTGYRAAIAAGYLTDRGYKPVAVVDGGVTDLLAPAPA